MLMILLKSKYKKSPLRNEESFEYLPVVKICYL